MKKSIAFGIALGGVVGLIDAGVRFDIARHEAERMEAVRRALQPLKMDNANRVDLNSGAPMPNVKLIMEGPFTEPELKRIIDVMRAIDREHQERGEDNTYVALVDDGHKGEADKALDKLNRVFPPVEDRRRDTYVIPRPKDGK